jgi:hypothetical protein
MVKAEVVAGVGRATGRSHHKGRDKDLTQHGDLLSSDVAVGNCLKTNPRSRELRSHSMAAADCADWEDSTDRRGNGK